MNNQSINNDDFDGLSFEEQCKIVFSAPLERRGELVVRSHSPEELTGAFSAEEMYLMVREMDSSNVPELIRSANFQQLEFMADFECWQSSEIKAEGFLRWLQYLAEAGNDRFELWLLHADLELIIAGLQKVMNVLKPFHEETIDDIVGDKPYFTLDGLYYIMIESDNLTILKRALSILFDHAKPCYYAVLEGILSESETIVEEDAYLHRMVRLGEKGFPEKEFAFSIYNYLTEDEWGKLSYKNSAQVSNIQGEVNLPSYPTFWQQKKMFIDDVFALLVRDNRQIQSDIYQEFVWLCNKVMVCKEIDSFSKEHARSAYEHVRSVLSVGFEKLSGGDPEKAHCFLCERWLEYIFRYGFSLLVDLRTEIESYIRVKWSFSKEFLNEFFGETYGAVLNGILREVPQFYDARQCLGLDMLRDFNSIRDVEETSNKLNAIKSVLNIIDSKFLSLNQTIDLNGKQAEKSLPVFKQFFITMFANFVISGELSIEPVESYDANMFLMDVFAASRMAGEKPHIDEKIRADYLIAFFNKFFDLSDDDISSLESLFDECFKLAEEELGYIDPRRAIDADFIESLLIKK